MVEPQSVFSAPKPDGIPFIASPAVNSRVETDTVEVSGTCPKNTQNYVIIRNVSKISGSTTCSDTGTFSTVQPLLLASNVFTVSAINTTGQETLNSVSVPLYATSKLVKSDISVSVDKGVIFYVPKVGFSWTINLEGGASPYKVNIDWGDNKVDSQETKDTKINSGHTYQNKDSHTVVVTVKDSLGGSQSNSFVATSPKKQKVVNAGAVGQINSGSGGSSAIGVVRAAAFGLYVLVFAVMLPFLKHQRYAPEIISDEAKIMEQ
ncbi:hypothetical protein A3F37_02670 [Candidatus Saccharibacteria bacterium RIFCSPHIGHO2_12_FULL_41_12]|nr:MAG: hypothetical protein A3F37_02670 [Candidatus Saccharibacteria bacterium RIFCSPHIGHO2_12_FULL_41_12]